MEGRNITGTPLTFVEWAFASYDELPLEQQAINLIREGSDWSRKYGIFMKEALRLVDATKISGNYQAERGRLYNIVQTAETETSRERKERFEKWLKSMEMSEYLVQFSNLTAGIRSPDPEQKAHFRALIDELDLWEKTPREIPIALLRVLERAKMPKGRRRIPTPWANVTEHMDAMRLAVAGGTGVYEAARARAALEQTAGEVERARTLAKLYRQKMALRE